MKKKSTLLLSIFLFLAAACTNPGEKGQPSDGGSKAEAAWQREASSDIAEKGAGASEKPEETVLSSIPAFSGNPSVELFDNQPFFEDAEKIPESFEVYSDLDELGRCGSAYACLGQDLMPTEDRDQISEVHPSGWHTVKCDWIDGGVLYNRCHLIAYSLSAENANEKNLITGTRYMNKEGMNPYEIKVANYIRDTGNHVLYRVTPIFEGDNLLASGVEMEAESVEDHEISFHVYCYNVQPGIELDYATGDSREIERISEEEGVENGAPASLVFPEDTTYILNTNTLKFHYMDCESVYEMNDRNRQPTNQSREELLKEGYSPCGSCRP